MTISVSIICLIASLILYCISHAFYHVQKVKNKKDYQILKISDDIWFAILYIFASLTFMKGIGMDSDAGMGWQLLCFLVGIVFLAIINYLINLIYRQIWPSKSTKPLIKVKIPRALKIVFEVIFIILALALALFFLYGIFISKDITGAVQITIILLLVALFLWGTFDRIKNFNKKD